MNDVVIVTGAASGLGAVYCRELTAAGYTVAGADVAPVEEVDGLTFLRTPAGKPGGAWREAAGLVAFARAIGRAVDAFRPDLLHAHSPALDAAGERGRVESLLERTRAAGNGAARQRSALAEGLPALERLLRTSFADPVVE